MEVGSWVVEKEVATVASEAEGMMVVAMREAAVEVVKEANAAVEAARAATREVERAVKEVTAVATAAESRTRDACLKCPRIGSCVPSQRHPQACIGPQMTMRPAEPA